MSTCLLLLLALLATTQPAFARGDGVGVGVGESVRVAVTIRPPIDKALFILCARQCTTVEMYDLAANGRMQYVVLTDTGMKGNGGSVVDSYTRFDSPPQVRERVYVVRRDSDERFSVWLEDNGDFVLQVPTSGGNTHLTVKGGSRRYLGR